MHKVFKGYIESLEPSFQKLMDMRFVSESDPMKQALLEMYVSVSLNTPYNDFDNH